LKRKDKIRVAQIGVGYWGPNILRNMIANENCDLTIVVEISSERREYVKNSYSTITVTDKISTVLEDPDIDAVLIVTPVETHFKLAVESLKAGKHILVEKPMATSVEEIEEIQKIAKEKNLIAMVGHTFIYNPAVRYVKDLIDNQILGDIRYIYSRRLNLGRIRSDVDAFWNLAPHDISIIQYWLNNPSPVNISRNGMDYIQKGIDDVVFVNIEYPQNIIANIHVSWLDPNKVRKITLVGSEKMVVYDDLAENKIEIYDKGIDHMASLGDRMDYDIPRDTTFQYRSGDIFIPKIKWEEPLKVELEHFLDCIINDKECQTDAPHAKKVVNILSMAT
tara:strand:+ start:2194 stop:3198 length:1005 start_codon:yes stop_codon:yes gene_type:complete